MAWFLSLLPVTLAKGLVEIVHFNGTEPGFHISDSGPAGIGSGAKRIAERMRFPVIVKPVDSSESRGVSGNIQHHVELAQAVDRARRYSRQFLIEKFYEGDDHRFLVIDGKVAHVTRHEPAAVIGNGTDTVEALVDALNRDPLRGPDRSQPYVKIKIGPDQLRMLESRGLTPASIPKKGVKVRLSSVSSLSTGGTAIDVSHLAHPDNIKLAERAARVIGLDICGLDIVSPDISRSHKDVETVIVEINQRPAFDSHDAASNWRNDIRERVMRYLYRGESVAPGLPAIVCVGSQDGRPSEVALVLHHILLLTGGFVGCAIAQPASAYLGPYRLKVAESERALLMSVLNDPRVEKALIVLPRLGRNHDDLLRSATVIAGHARDAEARIVAANAAVASGCDPDAVSAALGHLYPEALQKPCLAQVILLSGHMVVIGLAHHDYPPDQLLALFNAAAGERERILFYSGPASVLHALLKSPGAHFDRQIAEEGLVEERLRAFLSILLRECQQPIIVLCLTTDPETTAELLRAHSGDHAVAKPSRQDTDQLIDAQRLRVFASPALSTN